MIYDGLKGNRYEMAMLATWRAATRQLQDLDDVPFTKAEIVEHGIEIRRLGLTPQAIDVRNVPDIVYTFRARAELPAEILANGQYAIAGRGKGSYAFVRIPRPNRFPSDPPELRRVRVIENVPHWISPYLGNDEQCMLSSVNTNDLVRQHLDLRSAYQLQAHRRTTVQGWGQVELDGWYVGEGTDATHVGIAIEAKDASEGDRLNVAQLFGAALALRQDFPNLQQRLIGARPIGDRRIVMCEFNVPKDIRDLHEISDWVEYELVV